MKAKKIIKNITMLTLVIATITTTGVGAFAQTNKLRNNVTWIKGRNRVETSIELANRIKTDTAVITSSTNFADALSSYNLVSKYRAKLILVDNNTNLKNALQGVKKAYIVGGDKTVSNYIEEQTKSLVKSVERVSGYNRYLTNKLTLDKANYYKVIVADGRNYPDALSASGLAKYNNIGLKLVDGSRDYSTDRLVLYTVGGEKSVKTNNGKRIAGSNRYETSNKINSIFNGSIKAFVDGNNFADALSAINLTNIGNTNIVLKSSTVQNKDLVGAKEYYIIGGALTPNITSTTSPKIDIINNLDPSKVDSTKVPLPSNIDNNKPSVSNPIVKPSIETPISKPSIENTSVKPSIETPISKPIDKVIVNKNTANGNWVKKEKIKVNRKVVNVPIWDDRDVIEVHSATADGQIDLDQTLADKGILIHTGNPDQEYYDTNPAFIKDMNDMVANITEENQNTYVELLENKYKVPEEVAKFWVLAEYQNKTGIDRNDFKYTGEKIAHQMTDDILKYLNRGHLSEKGSDKIIWKRYNVGHKKTQIGTAPKYMYQKVKVSYEENDKTGETRNQIETPISDWSYDEPLN